MILSLLGDGLMRINRSILYNLIQINSDRKRITIQMGKGFISNFVPNSTLGNKILGTQSTGKNLRDNKKKKVLK